MFYPKLSTSSIQWGVRVALQAACITTSLAIVVLAKISFANPTKAFQADSFSRRIMAALLSEALAQGLCSLGFLIFLYYHGRNSKWKGNWDLHDISAGRLMRTINLVNIWLMLIIFLAVLFGMATAASGTSGCGISSTSSTSTTTVAVDTNVFDKDYVEDSCKDWETLSPYAKSDREIALRIVSFIAVGLYSANFLLELSTFVAKWGPHTP
ncbi:hypothetical protein M427DRAFT_57651 [Gonapodya prolifera JEL478]|uniref:Uncharacterized protein n=1 Tax=Gonapodya prolifera (strain JEL478) TaxID=1344416 RepID=A0A139ACF0_GONPJ|nr:hypothetical protein M427DRAFT_57651 [Gonapodya prolifera JEL478]|eukprot:KXS14481.1 hypothetical protein M427DRAFT_57651 [Gonapodya prolifera JEL478]